MVEHHSGIKEKVNEALSAMKQLLEEKEGAIRLKTKELEKKESQLQNMKLKMVELKLERKNVDENQKTLLAKYAMIKSTLNSTLKVRFRPYFTLSRHATIECFHPSHLAHERSS